MHIGFSHFLKLFLFVGGAVYSYKIPRSPLETFERTTLASGFPVTEPGPNQASPGFLTPYTLRRGARPSILVAGDGSREAYDLVPDGSLYTKSVALFLVCLIPPLHLNTHLSLVMVRRLSFIYHYIYLFLLIVLSLHKLHAHLRSPSINNFTLNVIFIFRLLTPIFILYNQKHNCFRGRCNWGRRCSNLSGWYSLDLGGG